MIILIAALAGLSIFCLTIASSYYFGHTRNKVNVHDYIATEMPEMTSDEEDRSLLQNLYRPLEAVLGSSNLFKHFKILIDQADLALREAELLVMMIAGLFVGLVVGNIWGSIMVLFFAGLGALVPYLFVRRKASKRKKAFEAQLPDMLGNIASTLKAGHSFSQAIASIVRESPDPTAQELKRVLMETKLGIPLEKGLSDMAERMGSKDFHFAVTTVGIQRSVGGSLSEILDMVSDTVRNRQQFRKKVKALTSMGSLSAYVLLGLPFVMMLALTLLNPEYMQPLFQTSTGHKLLALGAFFMTLGWLACKKIVAIKT